MLEISASPRKMRLMTPVCSASDFNAKTVTTGAVMCGELISMEQQ